VIELKDRSGEAKDFLRSRYMPPPIESGSEWVDKYRYCDDGSKYFVSTAEYQRGPLDAITNPNTEEIIIMASVQTMKTEVILNAVGYYAHRDPCSIMWAMPNLSMAKNVSKSRLEPMFQYSPELSGLLSDKRTRDSNNSLDFKKFPGGFIILSGANSPASFSSWPIKIALGDEVDRWGKLIKGEGDILLLFRKRTTRFTNNRKIILVSSPTEKETSRIHPAFMETNQQYFHVPCPHCGSHQVLEFKNLKFEYDKQAIEELCVAADEAGDGDGFNWKKKAIAEHIHAYFVCIHCSSIIEHEEKLEMVQKGEWRAKFPKIVKRQGFHIWQAYSPFVSWSETVAEFLYSHGYPDRMRVFVNTVLGELYENKGQRIEDAPLMDRREVYPDKLPLKIDSITCGIDVQADRIECELIGWASDGENWSLGYYVLWGATDKFDKLKSDDDETYKQLYPVFDATFVREDDVILPVDAIGMDTGYNTDNVHDFCEVAGKLYRIFALKGSSTSLKGTLLKQARAGTRRLKMFLVDGDAAKNILLERLAISPGERGSAHFPDSYGKEYFMGLTAEEKKTRGNVRTWEKVRERNEPVDTRVYAYAALKLLSPAWGKIRRKKHIKELDAVKDVEITEPKRKPKLKFGRR
jgi:phage terminase large subunit GpA-like protein